MTINPYDTLGLDKDCTSEQIKKAYKMAAKKHHPDKEGGDNKKFALVKTSYDTLKDKKKRDDYDKYGVIDENQSVGSKEETVANRLRQIFVAVLSRIPLDDLPYTDIIKEMKIEVIKKTAQLESQLQQARTGKDATQKILKKLEKKLKRKGGKPNFLLDLLRHSLTESNQQVYQIGKEQDIQQEMLNMVAEFSYDFEENPNDGYPYVAGFPTGFF